MIKKFKELEEIDQVVGNLYSAEPTLRETKFGYAYKRFCEKFYIPKIKEMHEELSNARVDNALENEQTKEILIDATNPRGYKYSKEGLKKLIIEEKRIKETWEEKEIEVEPFISAYIPELNESQREVLTGVLV